MAEQDIMNSKINFLFENQLLKSFPMTTSRHSSGNVTGTVATIKMGLNVMLLPSYLIGNLARDFNGKTTKEVINHD